MVDAPTLAALVLLGVRLSMQPAFDAAWGGPDGMYATRLGAGRAAALNPLADLATAGVPLAFGSDSPVTPVDPWARCPGGRPAPRRRPADLRAGGLPGLDPGRLAGRRARPHRARASCASARRRTWRCGAPSSLTVQAADGRFSSWSTDARAGIPLLPDLVARRPATRCACAPCAAASVLHDAL